MDNRGQKLLVPKCPLLRGSTVMLPKIKVSSLIKLPIIRFLSGLFPVVKGVNYLILLPACLQSLQTN